MAASFPEHPICGVESPSKPFLLAALEYTKQHTTPATVNHCLRSGYFALICSRKVPDLANTDPDLLMYACLMHDMGWSKNPTIISKDKRFEVDGANVARAWINQYGVEAEGWDHHKVQLIWDAIALHTTRSIAMYKEPEVVAIALGIAADIRGPALSDGLLTVDEYKAVVAAFPKLGLGKEVINIMCGLCRDKPETTYDNFVSEFGVKYGLDGQGEGQEEFAKEVEKNSAVNVIMSAIEAHDRITGP